MAPKKAPAKAKGGSLKVSNSLFGRMHQSKRVSFKVTTEEDEDSASSTSSNDWSATPVPVVVPAPGTSMDQERKRSSSSSTPTKTASKKKDDAPPQKRRKMKRPSYQLFSSSNATVKSRPSNTLTAQLNYTLVLLPAKLDTLEKNLKLCHAERINELDKLEADLLKRLKTISSLKVNTEDEIMVEKKYEVIEEMEEKLLELQKLREKKQRQLDKARPGLRANHGRRFVCCLVCAIRGDD